MFSLIRRISYGVIPRPDRPWEDDPTSNAPHTRRKRRYSSTEREADEQASKKARGDSATPSLADADGLFMGPPPVPHRDTSEVKEVTEGVREVDLDGRDPSVEPDPIYREVIESADFPEGIPLPEEKYGELDEPGSDATSTSSPAPAPVNGVSGEESSITQEAESEDSDDDVASSSEENTVVSEKDKLQEKKAYVKVLDPALSTIDQTSHPDTTKD